ncbi:MAG: NAD(+) diphosphatase, partial [Candidatus Hodarchaeales archaeon]
MSLNTFKYEMKPSTENLDPSYWFIYKNGEILTHFSEKSVSIPFDSNLTALNSEFESISKQYFGLFGKIPCFYMELPQDINIPENFSFYNLRSLYGLVEDTILWVAGRAFQLLHWDNSSKYCGRCGSQTKFKLDEKGKICPSCNLLIFPRISPAIIVGVLNKNQILLANGTRFPSSLYSVLAGFVEPGETLEECIRREIKEEVGIEIKNIRYFSSQSWPFPDSLMIGFLADYASGEISIDKTEINDAKWFTPDNLPPVPGKISIARKIIDWFVAN